MKEPIVEVAVSVFPTTEGMPNATTIKESKKEECGARTRIGASAVDARLPLIEIQLNPPHKKRIRPKKIKIGSITFFLNPVMGFLKSIPLIVSSPTINVRRKKIISPKMRNGAKIAAVSHS